MEKQITIEEGRSYNFKASAFSPILYNKLFPGHDFMQDMNKLQKLWADKTKDNEVSLDVPSYETFVRMAYLFAYQGLAPSPATTEEQKAFREEFPTPWDWVDTFGTFSMYMILGEIITLWSAGAAGVATGKKSPKRQREKSTPQST